MSLVLKDNLNRHVKNKLSITSDTLPLFIVNESLKDVTLLRIFIEDPLTTSTIQIGTVEGTSINVNEDIKVGSNIPLIVKKSPSDLIIETETILSITLEYI